MPTNCTRYPKIAGIWPEEGLALKLKGIYETRKSNYPAALDNYSQSLVLFTTLGNEVEIGKANLNIATVYSNQQDYLKSTAYGLKALASFEKTGDPNGQAGLLNLLGIVASGQTILSQQNAIS